MQISSDRQEPDTQRWALFAHITILSRRSSSLSAILTFWIHWSLFVLKFDDHLNKTNGGRWWKRRWGMVRMAWVPKKRELASIGVSPPHFLQHNGANIPPRAHPPLKAKDEVYLGRGRPLDIDGISSEGCDIEGCQGHPWYWGILGWHGRDIGAGAVCGIHHWYPLWYPRHQQGAGSRGPRLISAFQGLGITLSPSRWHLSQALLN